MQQLRQSQIRGTIAGNASLSDDIETLSERTKTYDAPVETVADLPLTDNDNGDVRLVLSEKRFYYWYEATQEWKPSADIRTESRTQILIAATAGQTEFSTGLEIGVLGGIASAETMKLIVNGMTQSIDDIEVSVDGNGICIVKWISTEFELDPSDHIALTYDILVS